MSSDEQRGHTTHVLNGVEEMEYREYTNDFGQDRSVAIPAQFRFTSTPTQITRRFHVELKRRGYSPLDSNPDRRFTDGSGPHYEGEICSREHWSTMKVLVFRGELVRLYPHDGWDVQPSELTEILDALETAFGAELEHYPIEREENNG